MHVVVARESVFGFVWELELRFSSGDFALCCCYFVLCLSVIDAIHCLCVLGCRSASVLSWVVPAECVVLLFVGNVVSVLCRVLTRRVCALSCVDSAVPVFQLTHRSSFGTVWQGLWRGSHVAIKSLLF